MTRNVYVKQAIIRVIGPGVLELERQSGEKSEIDLLRNKRIKLFGTLKVEDTNDLTKVLRKYDSVLIHYSHHGRHPVASYGNPHKRLNWNVIIKQMKKFRMDKEARLEIGREMVRCALTNMLKVMKRKHRRGKEIADEIRHVEGEKKRIQYTAKPSDLLPLEGRARKKYYAAFPHMIKPIRTFTRTRQPPQDWINAMLSYGNMLLYHTVVEEARKVDLVPEIGVLHSPSGGKPGLALDVADIFKPIIVECLVFNLANQGSLKREDFTREQIKRNGGNLTRVTLGEEGREKFKERYRNYLERKFKRKGTRHRYDQLIERELEKLEAFVKEGKEYQGFKYY